MATPAEKKNNKANKKILTLKGAFWIKCSLGWKSYDYKFHDTHLSVLKCHFVQASAETSVYLACRM